MGKLYRQMLTGVCLEKDKGRVNPSVSSGPVWAGQQLLETHLRVKVLAE